MPLRRILVSKATCAAPGGAADPARRQIETAHGKIQTAGRARAAAAAIPRRCVRHCRNWRPPRRVRRGRAARRAGLRAPGRKRRLRRRHRRRSPRSYLAPPCPHRIRSTILQATPVWKPFMTNPSVCTWSGVFPAATTQFDAAMQVDLPATQRVQKALLDDGVHGLVLMGTVGEGNSLSAEEKRGVLRAAVEVSAGKAPVIVG